MSKVREIMARRAAGEKGFTLIELLVVVVILVVLAAIAVPIFLNQAAKARNAKAAATAGTVGNVLASARSTQSHVTLTSGVLTSASPESGDQKANKDANTTITVNGVAIPAGGVDFTDATTFSVSVTGNTGCTYTFTDTDSAPVGTGC